MDEKPTTWLYTRGEWSLIDDPLPVDTEPFWDAVYEQYDRVNPVGAAESVEYMMVGTYELDINILIEPYVGKPHAPYPFMVWLDHARQCVYVADLPSYLQLLERLAPILSAAVLTANWFERDGHQGWKRGMKRLKRIQKQRKDLKKKSSTQKLPPAG